MGIFDALPNLFDKPYAGRCIDCGACGRICPHRAVLDPLGRKCLRIRRHARNWDKPLFDDGHCMSCRMCIDACPAACLAVVYTASTDDRIIHPYLREASACVACRFCALECPVDAATMKSVAEMTEAEKKSLDGSFAASVKEG